ncbi:HD-like signal output (HDOD) domain, no enzymatic activity [Thalassolituus maritimus]|uniref:HD-like signal output (HDOD) domain, no enzymatic activity n=1 Tax=Thalassolituus maritimus TaxID=484498 RepID=A0A1N7JKY2_9GAMM|nr:HDOD domain-containing protein [Thalassolituus maritimus]SIS49906.1 HD-like signal output (HDOD) domain, no enzymatic activity [Thalassolituus maritimus]
MAQPLTDQQISDIMQGIRVPPQPQVLVDLQMEQMCPDPDPRSIAKLISQDVGLTGAILKVVNSAAYNLSSPSTSVEHAVNLIGIDSVINVINGLAIRSELSDANIVQLNRFWDTATDIANISVDIARTINFEPTDWAYMLGLFHNCGIPLMMMRFDNYFEVMEESYAHPDKRVVDTENAILNTNHAVIGYYTAKSWRVPKPICDVIAEHHNATHYFRPENTSDDERKTLLGILKLAEHICGNYRILGQQDEDLEWQASGSEILAHLGLGEYDVEQLTLSYDESGVGAQNY